METPSGPDLSLSECALRTTDGKWGRGSNLPSLLCIQGSLRAQPAEGLPARIPGPVTCSEEVAWLLLGFAWRPAAPIPNLKAWGCHCTLRVAFVSTRPPPNPFFHIFLYQERSGHDVL